MDARTPGFTARDVAGILGLSAGQVRGFVRAGLVEPGRGRRGEYRFSLQDLAFLRTARGLAEHVPAGKVRRALRTIQRRIPAGVPLSGVGIAAHGDAVVLREGACLWEAESGQGVLEFGRATTSRRLTTMPSRSAREAEDWHQHADEVAPEDPIAAENAYRRAVELDPRHGDARVNLGCLLHEAGRVQEAEAEYRRAIEANPRHATAWFDLGVALEDLGRTDEAIAAYESALACDPRAADACYNLARLYEHAGRHADAIGQLKAYRRLTQFLG